MYPNNALSAGQLAIMAVVVVASLATWLTLVLLAGRQPRGTFTAVDTGPREEESGAAVTRLPHSAPPPDNVVARFSGAWRRATGMPRRHMLARRTGTRIARVTNRRTDERQLHDHVEA